jgi:hypothetical protein
MVSWALKEWDVAVTALLQGETVLLLRKGGLRERQGQFTVAARQVLLCPTFEHQQADLLKPVYQRGVRVEPPDQSPQIIAFQGWAEITQLVVIPDLAGALDLLPALIWNQRFVAERARWQPARPLYGLLLRVYRWPTAIALPWHAGYRGCRSWVEVGQSVSVEGSLPVLDAAAYQSRVDWILARLPQNATVLSP